MPQQPASRIEKFLVTIPAGTPIAAPVEIPTPWIPAELIAVEIRIPKGHSFLTGIRLLVAHAPAIPTTAGAWIVGNDETFASDLIGQVNTGAWSALGYNTDILPHTFYVTYYLLDYAHTTPAIDAAPLPTPLVA